MFLNHIQLSKNLNLFDSKLTSNQKLSKEKAEVILIVAKSIRRNMWIRHEFGIMEIQHCGEIVDKGNRELCRS